VLEEALFAGNLRLLVSTLDEMPPREEVEKFIGEGEEASINRSNLLLCVREYASTLAVSVVVIASGLSTASPSSLPEEGEEEEGKEEAKSESLSYRL